MSPFWNIVKTVITWPGKLHDWPFGAADPDHRALSRRRSSCLSLMLLLLRKEWNQFYWFTTKCLLFFFLQFFYHKLYSIYFKTLCSRDVPYFLFDDLKCFCNCNDMILQQMNTMITNNTREKCKWENIPNTKALIRAGKKQSHNTSFHFLLIAQNHIVIGLHIYSFSQFRQNIEEWKKVLT